MARIGIFCRNLSVTGAEAKVIEALIADERHEVHLVVNLSEDLRDARVWGRGGLARYCFTLLTNIEAAATRRFSSVPHVDRTVQPETVLRDASLLDVSTVPVGAVRGGGGLARYCFTLFTNMEAAATRRFSSVPYVDRTVQLATVLRDFSILDVSAVPDGAVRGHGIGREDCVKIRGYNCDILLNFAFADLEFEAPVPARSGVLTLDGSAGPEIPRALVGFWEWYDDKPYTESAVWRQDGEAGESVVLNRARYSTYRLSWNENRRRVLDRSQYLLLDAVEACTKQGENGRRPTLMVSDRPKRGTPGYRQLAVACFMYLRRFITRNIHRLLWKDQWGFALGEFNPTTVHLADYDRFFFPDKDRFWADPFVISADGKDYVFVEELKYEYPVGTINCLEIENDGIRSNSVVLEEPYHLSYPYIFQYDGAYYMCPEMSQNRKIEIFKCTDFPLHWERHATLMDGVYATEVSLHAINDRWWLFANMPRNSFNESCYELHLFSADNPLSRDWIPHPGNPVVSDSARARGGGGVLFAGGRLYRMAQGQDRYTYGSNLVVNEILELSEEVYVEHPVQKVFPDWLPGIQGVHHFARHQASAVVDFKRRIPRFFDNRRRTQKGRDLYGPG